MKKIMDPLAVAGQILGVINKGVLLTTAADGRVNTMTISWGSIGVEWKRPIFIAYVRRSRYTKELLEKNGEFTVNIPVGDFDSRILGYCGSKSGRDVDKIEALGLDLEEPLNISVPGIRQLPLTLECKVIYKQEQPLEGLPDDVIAHYYSDGDTHTAYYGQIVGAYLITDESRGRN